MNINTKCLAKHFWKLDDNEFNQLSSKSGELQPIAELTEVEAFDYNSKELDNWLN